VNRISGPETDASNLTTNLSTAGLAEDCMPGFSVPFGVCVGAREADGVDLSEGTTAESATFFLSPAGCAETGVEGRGEGAAPFYRDLVSAYPSRRSTRSHLGNYIRRSP
jgi:hypothetical protein